MKSRRRSWIAVVALWAAACAAVAAGPAPPTQPSPARPRAAGWLLLGEFASGFEDPGPLLALPNGDLLVTERGRGQVVILRDADRDGRADQRVVLRGGLDRPDGLLLRRDRLYMAHGGGVDSCPFLVGQLRPIPACRGLELTGASGAVRGLAMSPDEQTLYAAIGGTVAAFPPAGGNVRHIDPTPGAPVAGIAVEPRGAKVWRAVLGPDAGPEHVLEPVSAAPAAALAGAPPVTLLFYRRRALPAELLGGALLALPPHQRGGIAVPGRIIAVPFRDGTPAGAARELLAARDASFEPAGLAVMSDGSIAVADAAQGRIWRLSYHP